MFVVELKLVIDLFVPIMSSASRRQARTRGMRLTLLGMSQHSWTLGALIYLPTCEDS